MKLRALASGVLGVVTSLLLVLAVASPASGEDELTLSIRSVDATSDEVELTFMYTGEPGDLQGMNIRENGVERRVIPPVQTLRALGRDTATVWVVDTSAAANEDGVLASVKEGLAAIVSDMPDGDRMGIVTFDDAATVRTDLAAPAARHLEAIEDLTAPADAGRAVFDGLRRAGSMFEGNTRQANVVLITVGADTSSLANIDQAGASLAANDSSLIVIDIDQDGGADLGTLKPAVDRYGGTIISVDDAAGVPGAINRAAAAIGGQWVARYESPQERGSVDLTLTVGSLSRDGSYTAGSVSAGTATASVAAAPKPFGPSFIHGSTGLLLLVALVMVAAGLGTYAVVTISTAQDEGLTDLLRPYEEGGTVALEEGDQGLAQTAFLQRAVELTEDIAERQGLLTKVEYLLERADLPLRAAEALFFYVAGLIIVAIGSFALFGFMGGLIVTILVALVPPAAVNFIAGRRQKAFEALLPDTLHLLSGSLRAGYSLMQGVEAVSVEVEEPMGKELRRVVTEARLGREVEDSLDAVAERMESADFAWAVMAIRIQREVGGNLSELLLTVADTMVQRERLRRDISALTAEGKLSAIILGLLPIGLGLFMYMSNGAYMEPLFTTGLGKILLGLAVVSAGIGFAWMKKTIDIKI